MIMAARLALLSALGLLFSVFVSFPVACFCVLTFYVICIGMPFWMESIGGNMETYHESIDPYGRFGPAIRALLVPFLKTGVSGFHVLQRNVPPDHGRVHLHATALAGFGAYSGLWFPAVVPTGLAGVQNA